MLPTQRICCSYLLQGTFSLPLICVQISQSCLWLELFPLFCSCLHLSCAGWSPAVGGYLNDFVCSNSTVRRSLGLISLMDYEQRNKNRGWQSENDWTPWKGPTGNALQPDKQSTRPVHFLSPRITAVIRSQDNRNSLSSRVIWAIIIVAFWLTSLQVVGCGLHINYWLQSKWMFCANSFFSYFSQLSMTEANSKSVCLLPLVV